MSQSNEKSADPKPAEKPNKEITISVISGVVAVVVAIIGCIGGVAVAGIEPFAGWFFDRTPVPTLTVTSAPLTAEPVVTPQDATCVANHACRAGEDWKNSCIAGYNWTVYSSSDFSEVPQDGDGCYTQPILNVFYTKDNGLFIFAQPKALTTSKTYGLFHQLPQTGTVNITMDLDRIDNGQVWFGIFEQPDVKSNGVLLIAPPGDVQAQAFALKTMPEDKRIQVSPVFRNASGKYTLGFELKFGSIIANAEGVSMTPIPFTSPSRWLFIGYRAKLDDPTNGTADIQASAELKIGYIRPPNVVTETPNVTQTFQATFYEIDKQLRVSMKSNIAFNKPEKMKQEEVAVIELVLNPSMSQAELATEVVERGGFITGTAPPTESLPVNNSSSVTRTPVLMVSGGYTVDVVTSEIEITPRMKAELISQDPDAFTVQELHDDPEQVISSNDSTSWKWSITAKKVGTKTLTLNLYRLIKYDDKEFWREIESYKADIVVEITTLQKVGSFDWKWFIGIVVTIVLTLFGYFMNKNKDKTDKSKPRKTLIKKK